MKGYTGGAGLDLASPVGGKLIHSHNYSIIQIPFVLKRGQLELTEKLNCLI